MSNGQYNTQEYVRDNGGTLIAMQNTVSGATSEYYYTADNVGSIIALTNNTGTIAAAYTYDSYGNTTATSGGTFVTTTNPWRYGAGYTDRHGTIKFGARYYNPTVDRLAQPDPSGQEGNRYLYAGANPIWQSYPTGLSFWGDIGDVLINIGDTVSNFQTWTDPDSHTDANGRARIDSCGQWMAGGVATHLTNPYGYASLCAIGLFDGRSGL